MAARPIDDTAKDRLAQLTIGSSYTAATALQRAQIDEASRTAANRVNAFAQYFTLTDRTTDAGGDTVSTADAYQIDIAEWFHWWMAEGCYELSLAYRKEMMEGARRKADDSKVEALTAWTSQQIGTSNLSGGSVTLQTVRQFVLGHCVRRQKPLFPDIQMVDNCVQEVLNQLWNSHGWTFRRRTATMRLAIFPLATATWTESSKTITQTGAFSGYTFASGDIVRVEGGTGVVEGDYRLASKTSDNAIVLVDSLSAAGADLAAGDISGALQTVRFFGLEGETFDSCASRKWYFREGSAATTNIKLCNDDLSMEFIPADAMAAQRSVTSSPTGRPRWFRMQSTAGTRSWRFWPRPDQTYYAFGEIFFTGPSLPSTPTATTAFDKFPPEFRPVIREMSLVKTLASCGIPQDEDRLDILLSPLLAVYDDHGDADQDQSVRDVNHDYDVAQYGGYGV